jgi:hypothetical protein
MSSMPADPRIANGSSRVSQRSLRLVAAQDIAGWGWSSLRLVKELTRLDRAVLGRDLTTEQREGTVEQWTPLFARDTGGWGALADGRRIVAYYSICALSDRTYAQAKRGRLLDSQVCLDTTVPFAVPGLYKGYFACMAALPSYPRAGLRLIDAVVARLAWLAARGVYFEEMLANVCTDDGRRAAEGIGMSKICDHCDYGDVYGVRLNPWPTCFARRKWLQVMALYNEHVPCPGAEPTASLASARDACIA